MAINLKRVIINCGIPAIIAIVSVYWLRKRRKAICDHKSPTFRQTIKSTEVSPINKSLDDSIHTNNMPIKYTFGSVGEEELEETKKMPICAMNGDVYETLNVITIEDKKNPLICTMSKDIEEQEFEDKNKNSILCTLNSNRFEDVSEQVLQEVHNHLTTVKSDVSYRREYAGSSGSSESSDSGKGGSDILHANASEVASNGHAVDDDHIILYQFEIPPDLCGRLIGYGGRFVSLIKRNTNTVVIINRHHFSSDMKICTLKGTKSEIKNALNMIRNRFPITEYPDITLQQINLLNAAHTCAVPQYQQLKLPIGISCDVMMSSMINAGHFFLQQPTHPTYPSLSQLDNYMSTTYSQLYTPTLPQIRTGMICAVPMMGGWYRAVVTNVYYSDNECDVMYVDYGGYSRLSFSSLRQIHVNFMSLPFQATKCFLANVKPVDAENGWSDAANALFEELAHGQILQAYIVAYSENGVPLVHLFRVQGVSTPKQSTGDSLYTKTSPKLNESNRAKKFSLFLGAFIIFSLYFEMVLIIWFNYIFAGIFLNKLPKKSIHSNISLYYYYYVIILFATYSSSVLTLVLKPVKCRAS